MKPKDHIEALLEYAEQYLIVASKESEINYLHGCISTLKWVLNA